MRKPPQNAYGHKESLIEQTMNKVNNPFGFKGRASNMVAIPTLAL